MQPQRLDGPPRRRDNADITPCVSRTPSGGLHLIFRLQPGERPRNRARDIGAGLDSRGVKADGEAAGYFIARGSMLPDGRRYEPVDALSLEPIDLPAQPFENAAPAPRKLMGLATCMLGVDPGGLGARSIGFVALRQDHGLQHSHVVGQVFDLQRHADENR